MFHYILIEVIENWADYNSFLCGIVSCPKKKTSCTSKGNQFYLREMCGCYEKTWTISFSGVQLSPSWTKISAFSPENDLNTFSMKNSVFSRSCFYQHLPTHFFCCSSYQEYLKEKYALPSPTCTGQLQWYPRFIIIKRKQKSPSGFQKLL